MDLHTWIRGNSTAPQSRLHVVGIPVAHGSVARPARLAGQHATFRAAILVGNCSNEHPCSVGRWIPCPSLGSTVCAFVMLRQQPAATSKTNASIARSMLRGGGLRFARSNGTTSARSPARLTAGARASRPVDVACPPRLRSLKRALYASVPRACSQRYETTRNAATTSSAGEDPELFNFSANSSVAGAEFRSSRFAGPARGAAQRT
jgi:hypothetical protein